MGSELVKCRRFAISNVVYDHLPYFLSAILFHSRLLFSNGQSNAFFYWSSDLTQTSTACSQCLSVFIGAGEGWIPRWRHVQNDEKTLGTRYFDIGEHFNQRKYNKIPSEFGANCFGKRREDSGNVMGKFREHTIEEKRKLRNARQRRKRQKRATERKNSQEAKLRNEYANSKQHADKLRATASVYCRRWKDQCSENKRLRELLHKHKHRQTVS